MISITLSGTVEQVEKEIAIYFSSYPKFGYSTKIVQDYMTNETRFVVIERSRSCD